MNAKPSYRPARAGGVVTPAAQDVIARGFYPPSNGAVPRKYAGQFRGIKLFTIDKNFGGWRRAQAAHLTDGGVYDQIVAENNR